MSTIPRRSVLNLSDVEKEMIRNQNNENIKRDLEKRKKKVSEERMSGDIVRSLYYDIGMQDYRIYSTEHSDMSETYKVITIKELLTRRAFFQHDYRF